jgi:Tfp pilus assembly protein PilP
MEKVMTEAEKQEAARLEAIKQEAINKAVAKVYITKEQREAQTKEFTAMINKQRNNGQFFPKPTINDAPASFKLR